MAGIFILPILWWGLASFKPTQEILSVPPKLFGFEQTFDSYRILLRVTRTRRSFRPRINSISSSRLWRFDVLFDAVPTRQSDRRIVGRKALRASALGARRLRECTDSLYDEREGFAFLILSQRMIPPIVAASPLFFLYRKLGFQSIRVAGFFWSMPR